MQREPAIRVTGYRIEAPIGRGGMGEVYRAEQLSLGRKVALKVLRPDLAADDRFRRRFLRESRIAAAIDHPNVIPIYEAGEDDGLLYIAMRYVEGLDLATLLEREGRLQPARTIAILSQVGHALDAAHARGLVHRDVKPANILLLPAVGGGGEHAYLCDFGLMKELDAEVALTGTDQFVGSVPYVAPEQVEGRAIDGRTDVYSLGCVLFHCLSGSPPYRGQTDVEVVFAHLSEPPPPLSSRAPDLPPALDGVLARAMAKAKDDRYSTCSALLEAAAQVAAAGRRGSPRPDDATRAMVRPPAAAGTSPAARTDPAAPRPAPPFARPAAARPVAPPLARSPAPPAAARPASPPPHVRPRGHRARGRRWPAMLALLLLPAVAYLVAVQVFARAKSTGDRASQVAGAVATQAGGTAPACAGGWVEPQPGTPDRQAPLDAIRARLGVDGRFAGVDMRLFTGPDGVRRWYVKAYQEIDRSLQGRWLVDEPRAGERRVVAEAPYGSRGYRSSDWRAVGGGDPRLPVAVAGCLAGT
jgi:tRNA A-37 threonylcarbamoyl transferase component Bud32